MKSLLILPTNANKRQVPTVSQVATIKFVEGSTVPSVSLEDVKQQLAHYREQLSLTGDQLNWDYATAAFPYTFEQKPEAEGQWFYLKGAGRYRYIVVGTGSTQREETVQHFVQLVLPDDSTHGDKNKGNEISRYLGKMWKAEVQMFNGRTIYFNPRK